MIDLDKQANESWIEKKFQTPSEENLKFIREGYEQGYVDGSVRMYLDIMEKSAQWLKDNAYFYVNDLTGTLYEDMLVESYKKYIKSL